MALPQLHLYHPCFEAAPHLLKWLSEVESALHGDPTWDGCVLRRVPFDAQARFNVPTEKDIVLKSKCPAIFIQKVQASLLANFRGFVQRKAVVYSISPTCPNDILEACETARLEYEEGHPRIPIRELIAFLIIRKLERQDMWGGESVYKNFLWAELLPKGGFPKDVVSKRDVFEVADVLVNAKILQIKTSEGRPKYALGHRPTVLAILKDKAFENMPKSVRNYFDRSRKHVPARLLDYND